MKFNQEIKDKIQAKEDLFFDKSSKRYNDMSVFDELFEILSEPDFKNNFPKQHFAELNRIRDLKNCIDTARERGEKKAKTITIKIAKNMLNDKVPIEMISKITGLTISEIEKLKSEKDEEKN